MHRPSLLFLAVAFILFFGLADGCKKDNPPPAPTHVGTETSFTEEFENVNTLQQKGWVMTDKSTGGNNSASATWIQGYKGYDKGGDYYGFDAFSYNNSSIEFAYSRAYTSASIANYSSWLISPVLSVKNGDKISFYTRGDSTGTNYNRMEVRLGYTSSPVVGPDASSVGGYSELIFNINPNQNAGGYPQAWTKYEYTFSGLSGKSDVRVGFRHYMINMTFTKGIGIDLFKFQVN